MQHKPQSPKYFVLSLLMEGCVNDPGIGLDSDNNYVCCTIRSFYILFKLFIFIRTTCLPHVDLSIWLQIELYTDSETFKYMGKPA